MQIIECEEREGALLAALVDVWERSVRATHAFLSKEEILAIREFVPQALSGVEKLVVALEGGVPLGFMGAEAGRLEMLFLAPEARGLGLGRLLLEKAIARYSVEELTVNEQNPQAVGFYEHLGFRTYKRTELDEEGRPYPLLYMRREATQISND